MQVKGRLGKMLMEVGLATEEQIQDALKEQRETGLKMGQKNVDDAVIQIL
jgi:hypothetical protein